MAATNDYEFIGFGAMDVTRSYEFYRVWVRFDRLTWIQGQIADFSCLVP
jgi:hypothetical protein